MKIPLPLGEGRGEGLADEQVGELLSALGSPE